MERILTRWMDIPDLRKLDVYVGNGGYQALRKALFDMSPEQIINEVKNSNLRGRGGAAFATGVKWSFIPKESKKPVYLCCNADESEPGTFANRYELENDPHCILEGMAIACRAVGSHIAYVYLRGEFTAQKKILDAAIAEAYANNYLGKNILGSGFDLEVYTHRGAGAYICGEETGLLESLEGRRAYPRNRPPFPAIQGAFGSPTVVNNVETLSMLPFIIREGGDAFAKIGSPKNGGTVVFSVSGHVEKEGVYEVPMGSKLRDVLALAGGVRAGHKLKCVIPGGTSMPPLLEKDLDLALDFDAIRAAGTFLGAGGMIVLDETADAVEVAHNIERFLTHESCGQCTPCREGSFWSEEILERILEGKGTPEDMPNLARVGENITGKVICALGDTVGVVTRAYMSKFPEDFKKRIPHGKAS